mgnify:CR=1 FL=1
MSRPHVSCVTSAVAERRRFLGLFFLVADTARKLGSRTRYFVEFEAGPISFVATDALGTSFAHGSHVGPLWHLLLHRTPSVEASSRNKRFPGTDGLPSIHAVDRGPMSRGLRRLQGFPGEKRLAQTFSQSTGEPLRILRTQILGGCASAMQSAVCALVR